MGHIHLKILFSCFLMLLMSKGYTQKSTLVDVVVLKNGSIYRGTILKPDSTEKDTIEIIKILTLTNIEFGFTKKQIEKVYKEVLSDNPTNENNEEYDERGTFVYVETNFGQDLGIVTVNGLPYKNIDHSFDFRFVAGYKFHKNFLLGLGVGINAYTRTIVYPFTLEAMIPMATGRIAPLLNLSYGFSRYYDIFQSLYYLGEVYNISMGFKINNTTKRSLYFKIGSRYQGTNETFLNPYGKNKIIYFNFVTIGTSLLF